MIIATSGHVDHGKTLLVHTLTGIETDRLEEEKDRGLTIDLGFAYINRDDECIGFIDVPGHIRFIRNMLAGVAAIDFGMLVIAADDGPMPQTLEHLAILDLLGVDQGCIALTKIDRVDPSRIPDVEQEVRQILLNTGLEQAPIFPVSGLTGEGIEELSSFLWSEATRVKSKSAEGNFRLAIDRAFTVKGSGNVVTGSVFSGEVNLGDELVLLPQNKPVRVRGIHRQNQTATSGTTGDRCAINITGDVDRDQISRGNWLSSSPHIPYSDRIDITFKVLQTETRPVSHWTPVHVHSAAQHVSGRIATLESRSVSPGEIQLAQLVLSEPINVCNGDRIILRDQSATKTLGGGTVIDAFSPRRGRAKPERLSLLNTIRHSSSSESIKAILTFAKEGVRAKQLQFNFNLKQFNAEDYGHLDADGYLYDFENVENAKKDVIDFITGWHRDKPQEAGPTEVALTSKIAQPNRLLQKSIQLLVEEKKLTQMGARFKLTDHDVALAGPELALWKKVEPILKQEPLKPPVLHELAKKVNLPVAATDKLLGNCVKFGLVLKPVKNRFFLPEAINQLKQTAMNLADESDQGKFTVIEFRDRVGIGRNLCIEILEYFDRSGFTRRDADHRTIQDPSR